MSLQNKLIGTLFRRISGVVIDATTGKTGIKTADGVYTISFSGEGKEVEHTVHRNIFDGLSFNVPGFASQVAFDKVNAGDIVVGADKVLGFVVGKTNKALRLADTHGMTKTYTPPKVEILGGAGSNGVMVVQSLFSLTGSAEGAQGLGQSLLPLMLLGGDNADLDKILPFVLMQGAQGNAAGGLNSILPLLLLKGKGGLGGDLDPLTLMALTGGLGGAGGAGAMNPMLLLALSGKGGLGGLLGDDEPAYVAPALNSSRGTVAPALRRSGY